MSFLGGNPIRNSFVLSSKPNPPEPVRSPSPKPVRSPSPKPNPSAPVSKSSGWLSHIKSYQTEHKVSYKEAMKMAKSTYKK